MGGFGQGPFGQGPFGDWEWSRRILFESLPEIYKQLDLENGKYLEMFVESLRPSLDQLRLKFQDLIKIRDPLLVRTQYDEVRRLRLGPVLGGKGALEQSGVSGAVDGLQQFVAPTARFRGFDVGKPIFVAGSVFPGNNRQVTIARVINNTTVVTDPLLVIDTGPLRWQLRSKVTPPTDKITVEVRSGDISEVTPSWLVFDGFSDSTVVARRQFVVPTTERQLLTEQEGKDGVIDAQGRFLAGSAQLDQLDVGKPIVFVGSLINENNGKYEITRIVEVAPGDTRAELSADPVLEEDSGISWAILPHGQLDLAGTSLPRGLVEQEGTDLTITVAGVSTATVETPSALFSIDDIGKMLSIRGSQAIPSNDGIFRVTSVTSATKIEVEQRDPAVVIETSDPLTWELRSPTLVGDFAEVDIRAPSMIVDLAPDFGIEVDTQESESRQRSWVRNVSRWTKIKGIAESYVTIGKISGFDISVFQLFRVTPELYSLSPGDSAFEVGEPGAGRSGSNGFLQILSSLGRFNSATAAFVPTDVGRHLHISGAAVGDNNQIFTIASIISSTEVEFIVSDTVVLPEANNGVLSWAIVRLYSTLPPLRPKYDEVNSDLLEEIVEAGSNSLLTFRPDMFCWDEVFNSTARVDVISVTTLTPGVHQVSLVGTTAFPNTPEVITNIGHWQFVSLVSLTTDSGELLTGTAPEISLFDASAQFDSSLVGQWIDISGATTPGNNGLFQILAVTSATTLVFFSAFGVGEIFPGSYEIFREVPLFVDSIPALTPALAGSPVTGTGDSLTVVGVGADVRLTDAAGLFTVDMVGKHLRLAGATSSGNNGIFRIKNFVSSSSIEYENSLGVTEAFPGTWGVGLGIYTVVVSAAVPPVSSGPGQLRYVCNLLLTCDYCPSNKVKAVIEASEELLSEGDVQVERLLERLVLRLEEVTPIHVELITHYRASVEASIVLDVTVEPTLV